MRIVLVSTYDLGRQPFGLASPAAWLRREGHEVTCADLSRAPLPRNAVRDADLVCFFLPMHTATRLFLKAAPKIRMLNERAVWCAYGLYAPLNSDALRDAGVSVILGGEFEQALADLASGRRTGSEPASSMARLRFVAPEREGLPSLDAYAHLRSGSDLRVVGYTEASRGCKHLCRHCPIPAVYHGAFRVVQQDAVLEDIRRQVEAGARHITFGDPDFFNGPGHAMPLIDALHREWPDITYDVTIKVEHLLRHRELVSELRRTGCAFVTTAVESLDDAVLEKLAKGHTRADFGDALRLTRAAGLPLSPTFIPFTPWTTLESYQAFLAEIARLDLIEQVAPVQFSIRLLIPNQSLLLDLPEVRDIVAPFDPHSLSYPWTNPDERVDNLWRRVTATVRSGEKRGASRAQIFREVASMAGAGEWEAPPLVSRAAIPFLTEPWYC